MTNINDDRVDTIHRQLWQLITSAEGQLSVFTSENLVFYFVLGLFQSDRQSAGLLNYLAACSQWVL